MLAQASASPCSGNNPQIFAFCHPYTHVSTRSCFHVRCSTQGCEAGCVCSQENSCNMRAVAIMRRWQRIQFRLRQTGTHSGLSIYADNVRCFASGASSTSATTLRVVRLQGGPGGQSSKYTSTWADLKKEAGVHGRDMIQLLQKSTLPQFAILPRKNSLLLVRAAAQTASDARPAP